MRRRLLSTGLLIALLAVPGLVLACDEDIPTPLSLRAEWIAYPFVSGKMIEFRATFRAWHLAAVKMYVPPERVLRWRLIHADGRVFAPHRASRLPNWTNGLIGKLLVLEPESEHTFHMQSALFLQLGKNGKPIRPSDALPLPPGLYTVHAEYRRDTTRLPHGKPNFEIEYRDHPDVYTGKVTCRFRGLDVTRGTSPMVRLAAPLAVTAGDALPLTIKIDRAATSTVSTRAVIRVMVFSNGGGRCDANYVLQDKRLVQDNWLFWEGRRVPELGIEPGETFSAELDLARETFTQLRGGRRFVEGSLYELLGVGDLRIVVGLHDNQTPDMPAGVLLRSMRPLAPAEHAHLELRLDSVSNGQDNPEVEVVLTNSGTSSVRVPGGLTYGRHVFFSMVDENKPEAAAYRMSRRPGADDDVQWLSSPGPYAKIAAGLEWAGAKLEAPARAHQKTYVLLPPGGELRRRFRLGDLVAKGGSLESRVLQVRAYFRNREPGHRIGLTSVFVGLLESAPITVRGVPGRRRGRAQPALTR